MKKISIFMLLVFVFVSLAESLAFADLPTVVAGAASTGEIFRVLPDGAIERKTETVIEPSIKGGVYGAAGGAATGAVIGSFVPVIGTAVGAGVGAVFGGIAGWIFGPAE